MTEASPRRVAWCPTCASENDPRAATCWMCRRPIPRGAVPAPAESAPPEVVAAFGGAILVSLTLVALVYECVQTWGGLGVLSLFIVAPAVGLLLRVTWPNNAEGGLKAVAFVVAVLGALALATLALMAIAAVLLIAICTGKIG